MDETCFPLIVIVVVVVNLSSTLKHVQVCSGAPRPLKLSIRDLLREAVACTLESRNGQITIRCTATLHPTVPSQISLLFPWTVRGKSAASTRRVSTSTVTQRHLKLPMSTRDCSVLRHTPPSGKKYCKEKRERGATPERASIGDIGNGLASEHWILYLVESSPLPLPAEWPVFQPTGLHRRTSRQTQSRGRTRAIPPTTDEYPAYALQRKSSIEWRLALAAELRARPAGKKNVETRDY